MLNREKTLELFERARHELNEQGANTLIELDLNQLREFTHIQHEQLAILFDLALEEISQPESGKRYLDLAEIKEQQHADSSALAKALGRFERVVQAPFQKGRFKISPQKTTSYRQPIARAALKVIPADPRSRLSALIIDSLTAALAALAVTVVLSPLISGEFSQNIDLKLHQTILGYVPILALYLKLLLISLMLSPTLFLIARGKTFGLAFNRIKLASKDGAPPKKRQIILRGLLTPLSLVTLAPLAIISRKKTLSDILSKTAICKI